MKIDEFKALDLLIQAKVDAMILDSIRNGKGVQAIYARYNEVRGAFVKDFVEVEDDQ